MKRVVLGVVLLMLCGAAGLWWFGWPYATDVLRVRLEHELGRAVGSPSRIGELAVSVVPLQARVNHIVLGTPPLVEIESIDVHVHPLASVLEGRPVLSIVIDSPAADLSNPPHSEPAKVETTNSGAIHLPAFDVRTLALRRGRLRFRLGTAITDLTVAEVVGHVKTGLLGNSLAAGVAVTSVELQRKSYRAKIDELQADGGSDAGGLFVNTATLKGEGITASAHSTAIPHRHAVSATFEPGILGIVVDELSSIDGQAQLDGILNGDLANPILDGRLVINQGGIGHHTLGNLDTHVIRKGATLNFDDVHLVGKRGDVRGAVSLTIDKEVPIHGDLRWQDVDLEGLLAVIGQPVPFRNQFDATTTVNGSLDPLDLGVHGTGVLKVTEQESPKDVASWEIAGRVHPNDLHARLEVTQPESNQVTTEVTLEGAKMEKLQGSISLKAADLAALNRILPRPVPELALTGQAEGQATLSGATEHPVVTGMITMTNVTVVGTPASRISGDFAITGTQLKTNSTKVEAGTGGAELNGVVALDDATENDWRLNVHELSTDLTLGVLHGLAGVAAPISGGTIDGTFGCHGVWARGDTQTNLTAKSSWLYQEPIAQVDVQATTVLPKWSLHLRALHADNETLTVDGSGDGKTGLQATIDLTPINLANLRGAGRRRLTGSLVMHGQLSGEALRPDGTLDVTISALGLRGRHVGDVVLRAAGRAGDWTLDGNALAGTLRIGGSAATTAPWPYKLNVTWQDTDLAKLAVADESLHIASTGEITLAGSLRGPATPSGVIRVSNFTVSRDEGQITLAAPAQVDVDRGRFRIRSLALSAQGSQLTATGEWTLLGDVGLDVHGEADLVLLELFGRPFNAARGQLLVTAHVGHTSGPGWNVRGGATLRDAALDLGLPVAFTGVNGTFTLVGSRVQVDELRGRSGGGDFSIAGAVDLNRGPDISWTLREVALTMPEWLEERISGKGQVQGKWKVMTVSGDIEVLNALYDRRLELTDLLPWFKEHVAPAPRIGPAVTEVRLDLHVHAPDGVFIDNNFAKAEMRADLRITGTTDKPGLQGTIEILNGEVTFRNRVFTLTGGSIDFADPYDINPVINIGAETQVSTADAEYTIAVAVSGTADQPRVQFTADDPNLSQNDVLSLVAMGHTTAESQREGGGVGVGDVLALLPSQYGGDVRSLFGVDRLEVEPAYVPYSGTIEPRVTIGKDITDRIRALASSSFGVDARRTMQLEYRVTRRFSLLGSWEGSTQEQAGAFGGDIKFRYEFRKLPFSLLRDASDSSAPSNAP